MSYAIYAANQLTFLYTLMFCKFLFVQHNITFKYVIKHDISQEQWYSREENLVFATIYKKV